MEKRCHSVRSYIFTELFITCDWSSLHIDQQPVLCDVNKTYLWRCGPWLIPDSWRNHSCTVEAYIQGWTCPWDVIFQGAQKSEKWQMSGQNDFTWHKRFYDKNYAVYTVYRFIVQPYMMALGLLLYYSRFENIYFRMNKTTVYKNI